MTSLPIVERELGIASRKLGSWLSRWIIAIVAVCFGGLWLGIAYLEGGMIEEFVLGLWFFICLGNNIFWGLRAMNDLKANFRQMAARAAGA